MAVAEHSVGQGAPPSERVGRRMIANLGAWTRTLFSGREGRSAPRIPALPFAVISLICVTIVIAAAMVALDARLIALQRSLPSMAVKTFHVITDLGKSGWILLPTGLALLVLAALVSPRVRPVPRFVLTAVATRFGFVFVAVGLPALLVTIVKRMIGRQRPNVWVETNPFDYIPFHGAAEFASFPSGHSTTAFATAVAIGALYPRLRLPLLMLALVVAISRVAISTHYPSDVLAGAVVGSIGALMVQHWFALRRLGFAVDAASIAKPMRGPSWKRLKAALRTAWRA